MFYALDASTCSWVHASKSTRDGSYTCDCPDHHPVCLKLPSGRENVEYRTPHFSHLPKSNTECRGGGESAEHKAAKHHLREMKGQYSFVVERCPECKDEVWETCSDGTVSVEVRSADGRWWYDCVYKADDYEIALEVFHTHATTQEKIDATRRSGMQLAEFHADEVNDMVPGAKLTNLQTVTRVCGEWCEDRRRMRLEKQRAEAARREEIVRQQREAEEKQRCEEARRMEEERLQREEAKRIQDEKWRIEDARRAQIAKERYEDENRAQFERDRLEERREIAGKWQELKRHTEAERAKIISDSRAKRGDRAQILARWADLKAWRGAERAKLLQAWRAIR